MTRWLSLALVFGLGALSGWIAIAIGAAKTDKAAPAVESPAVQKVSAKGSPELEALRDKLSQKVSGIGREDIRPSAIPGIYEIQRGHMFGYVSADGRYLIQGDLVNLETGEEVTENHRRTDRLTAVKALGNQYIEFAPSPPVLTKYTINVFTDIDCGYCRKLHKDMAGYNAKGIAVRYLFFPRSGPNTDSFYKAESVWCSADRRDSITKAKSGQSIANNTECSNPILKQYQLGVELGVRGTPAMVLPNGDLYPGYVPPDQLVVLLGANDASESASAAQIQQP